MNNQLLHLKEADGLLTEISRLRGEVARLQAHVAHLDELAHRDSLVDLPNRRGFMRELEKLISHGKRYDEQGALLFVDLDDLKLINDSFGHQAGDLALIHVSRLLVDGVRHSDCVARLGGDEFGLLLVRADEVSARETARRLADRIAGSDFNYDGDTLPLSVSIGVAMIAPDDQPNAVMSRADAEMYEGKSGV